MEEGKMKINMKKKVLRKKEGNEEVVELEEKIDKKKKILWKKLMKGVLEDVEKMEENVFKEEEEKVKKRNEIKEVVEC